MDRSEVAIIIPAWNEEKTIGSVVKKVSAVGTAIVVDDGSTDSTAEVAEASGALVFLHNINMGYDKALNSGFEHALELGFKYSVTFDADGQHDALLLNQYINHLENGMDFVLGVRPNHARIAEHLFALYTQFRFGIKDPLCGMKGYRMEVYSRRGWFDSYGSIGTELVLWAAAKGFKFCQVPVPITKRVDSPRFGRLLRANFIILRAMLCSMVFLRK